MAAVYDVVVPHPNGLGDFQRYAGVVGVVDAQIEDWMTNSDATETFAAFVLVQVVGERKFEGSTGIGTLDSLSPLGSKRFCCACPGR